MTPRMPILLACFITAVSSSTAMALVAHETTARACVLSSCLEGTDQSSQSFTDRAFDLLSSATIGETPFLTWFGSASAGGSGMIDIPFSQTSASGFALARWIDDVTAHSTPTWSGPGRMRFSYHITGSVDVASVVTHPILNPDPVARGSVYFECAAAGFPCQSPDLGNAPPGAAQLVSRLYFDTSQTVDVMIDFDVSVSSDVPFTYAIAMGPVAQIYILAGTDVPLSFIAMANSSFGSTGKLAAVTLYDMAGNVVSDARLTSAAGIDYVNLAAIPEPAAAWLFVAGILVVLAARRFKK